MPGVAIDEERIVSSTGALSLEERAQAASGGGRRLYRARTGSVWRRLGSEVPVVEFLDRITPGLDGEIAKQFQRILHKQGMKFQLSTKVVGVEKAGGALRVSLEAAAGGEPQERSKPTCMLVSIGRRPYTDGLGLDKVGVALDAQAGASSRTAHFKTNIAGIWAIGDCREGPMLAHKAEDEAVACAERIAGRAGHVNYDAIPAVVYTAPEVATRRQDRRGTEGGRHRLQDRQIPLHAPTRAPKPSRRRTAS